MSRRQIYAVVLVALGEFIDGYDLIVMGAALILLRPQFGLTPSQIGLLAAPRSSGPLLACSCSATFPTASVVAQSSLPI